LISLIKHGKHADLAIGKKAKLEPINNPPPKNVHVEPISQSKNALDAVESFKPVV
jgi:hypothetical protein